MLRERLLINGLRAYVGYIFLDVLYLARGSDTSLKCMGNTLPYFPQTHTRRDTAQCRTRDTVGVQTRVAGGGKPRVDFF